jgi:hypothetical protein
MWRSTAKAMLPTIRRRESPFINAPGGLRRWILLGERGWLNGVLVVAAAGNNSNNTRFYPAAYNHVLSVAATNSTDHKADFSTYGNWVDVCAPGDIIYSTWSTNSYTSESGTSMASPITAGLAALLKAANPTWTPDEISTTIITTADNIDALNPGYVGQLGGGRINAHNALGSSSVPNIRMVWNQVSIIGDDGDGVLNPGESFSLMMTLNNIWADARNVRATVRGAGFTPVDSTALFGDIAHGDSATNMEDSIRVTAQTTISPGWQPLTIHITADSNYAADTSVLVYVSMDQIGFPRDYPGNLDSPPIITDVDRDGANEIVFGCMDRNVYVIRADGSTATGWPKSVTNDIISAPAVGDIDHDGVNEVVVASKDGKI